MPQDSVADLPVAQPAPAGLRLPGWALAGLYLAVCLAPLALVLADGAAPASPWSEAAAAAGMVALAGMAVQTVTSGRFELFAGRMGIDMTMAFHKVAARWILILALLHPAAYVVPTFLEDPALGWARLAGLATSERIATGGLAWLCLLAVVAMAVARKRLPLRYEVWRGTHLALALAGVGLGLHHALTAGYYSAEPPVAAVWWLLGAGVLAAVGVLYGLRWWRLHARPWRLASVTPVAPDMWELDIQPQPGTPPLRYHAGQFVWLTTGRRRFPLLDNPFSIADSPLRPGVSLIVKAAGDFTDQVGALPPGTAVGLDGPHGEFGLAGRSPEAVLLIAGGVGIAPILGQLRDLAARKDPRPVRLIYAAGSPEGIARQEEIAEATQDLDLRVWLVAERAGDDWAGEVGLVDRALLEAALDGLDTRTTVALICGPGGMITAVADALDDLGLPMDSVVYERFDYAEPSVSRQDRRRAWLFLAVGAALGAAVLGFALR